MKIELAQEGLGLLCSEPLRGFIAFTSNCDTYSQGLLLTSNNLQIFLWDLVRSSHLDVGRYGLPRVVESGLREWDESILLVVRPRKLL